MDAAEISRTGLDVEWRRLDVIANNLANVNTSRTATGEPFRPMRLVSGPKSGFSEALAASKAARRAPATGGVEVYGVEPLQDATRRVYDPQHPHADADGFVSYPAVDHAAEMALLMETSRAYEANVVAMGAAQRMYAKALEIGRR